MNVLSLTNTTTAAHPTTQQLLAQATLVALSSSSLSYSEIVHENITLDTVFRYLHDAQRGEQQQNITSEQQQQQLAKATHTALQSCSSSTSFYIGDDQLGMLRSYYYEAQKRGGEPIVHPTSQLRFNEDRSIQDLCQTMNLHTFTQQLEENSIVFATPDNSCIVLNDDQVDVEVSSTLLPAMGLTHQQTIEATNTSGGGDDEDDDIVLLVLSNTPQASQDTIAALLRMGVRRGGHNKICLEGHKSVGQSDLVISEQQLTDIFRDADHGRRRRQTLSQSSCALEFHKLSFSDGQQRSIAASSGLDELNLNDCSMEDSGRTFATRPILVTKFTILERLPFNNQETLRLFLQQVSSSYSSCQELAFVRVAFSDEDLEVVLDWFLHYARQQNNNEEPSSKLNKLTLSETAPQYLDSDQRKHREQRLQQAKDELSQLRVLQLPEDQRVELLLEESQVLPPPVDSDTEENEQSDNSAAAAAPLPPPGGVAGAPASGFAGWGDKIATTLQFQQGTWKCEECMLLNTDPDASQCAFCEAKCQDHQATGSDTTTTTTSADDTAVPAPAPASSTATVTIGPPGGGFIFSASGTASSLSAGAPFSSSSDTNTTGVASFGAGEAAPTSNAGQEVVMQTQEVTTTTASTTSTTTSVAPRFTFGLSAGTSSSSNAGGGFTFLAPPSTGRPVLSSSTAVGVGGSAGGQAGSSNAENEVSTNNGNQRLRIPPQDAAETKQTVAVSTPKNKRDQEDNENPRSKKRRKLDNSSAGLQDATTPSSSTTTPPTPSRRPSTRRANNSTQRRTTRSAMKAQKAPPATYDK